MFYPLFIKEFKLLKRDLHALAVLFILPAAFLVLMSLALAEVNQDKPPYLAIHLAISQPSEDAEFFTAALAANLTNGQLLNTYKPKYPQLILPTNFADNLLTSELKGLEIVFPATAEQLTRQQTKAAITLALAQTKLHAFLLDMGLLNETSNLETRLKEVAAFTLTELQETTRLASGKTAAGPNATQHSVPAWLIFGMFFIMLPMANSFLHEQKSGVLLRLQTLGVKPSTLLLSKLTPFAVINLVQLCVLLAVGIYFLPLIQVEPLQLGGSFFAWVILAACLTLASCGLGLAVAASAKTSEQALLLSGGLNLLLAALGGIMVPASVMPEVMQTLSQVSPMSWALNAFTQLLVGQAEATDLLVNYLVLLSFAAITGFYGLLMFKRKLKENTWQTTT